MLAITSLQDGICTYSITEEEAFLTKHKTPGTEDNVNRNNMMKLSAK